MSLGAPLVVKPPEFDEDAIRQEFHEEHMKLEERSRQLDFAFQELVRDMRLWIAASTDPVSDEAKYKYELLGNHLTVELLKKSSSLKNWKEDKKTYVPSDRFH